MNITLNDLIYKVIDNRGKNPPNYSLYGVPVIDNYLINDNYYPDLNKVNRYISFDIYNQFIRCKTNKDDVLITLVGNGYGNVALSPSNSIIIQNTIGLRANDNCHPKYLYYLLLGHKKEIKNLNLGCAQPSIKVSDLLNLIFDIHSFSIQQHIVNTISSALISLLLFLLSVYFL